MKEFLIKIYDLILPLILKFNRRVKSNKSDGNIGIISLHKLGDSVFTIPAIKNIIKHHKNKNVLLICFRENLDIYKLALTNIQYQLLDRSNFYFGGRIGGLHARRIIKMANAERIYDITGCITSASLLFNCRANEVVGINEFRYKPLYDVYSGISNGPHMTDIYLNAIKPVIKILPDLNNGIAPPTS